MTKISPPKVLQIKDEGKIGIFNIQSIDLIFSNNIKKTYWRIKSSSKGAVSVIAIDNNDLILISEYAAGTLSYRLGFVRGGIDQCENIIESAKRELQEEIGYNSNDISIIKTVHTNIGYQTSKVHILIAKNLYKSKLQGDEPEEIEIVRWPINKIDDLFNNPDFSDACDLIALHEIKNILKK